jgi:quinol monooxygenase YgiN
MNPFSPGDVSHAMILDRNDRTISPNAKNRKTDHSKLETTEQFMFDYKDLKKALVVTAFWEAKPGEAEAVAGILQKFSPKAQNDSGVKAFIVHQSKSEPSKFFFYEVFEDPEAFEAHQTTPHFKPLVADQALPKLARRERMQYSVL